MTFNQAVIPEEICAGDIAAPLSLHIVAVKWICVISCPTRREPKKEPPLATLFLCSLFHQKCKLSRQRGRTSLPCLDWTVVSRDFAPDKAQIESGGLRTRHLSRASRARWTMAEQKALASPGGLTWSRVCKECGQCHENQESHVYEYQDEVDDELVCHICLQPLLQPVDTPCGHTYCLQCLSSFLREQDFCPVDRQRVALQQCRSASLLVRNLLDKLTVLCPFHNECQQSMQRCELQPHLHNRSVYEVHRAPYYERNIHVIIWTWQSTLQHSLSYLMIILALAHVCNFVICIIKYWREKKYYFNFMHASFVAEVLN